MLRQVFGARRSSVGETFRMLDGLRGLAVLLVVVGHMYRGGLAVVPSARMVVAGMSGVQLFFVLSSFLLASPLLAASAETLRSPRTWATYFARRLLRIYPLYALVLVVGSCFPFLSWALFGPHQISVVDHLLLRQGVKILWAIPVEMKFYFVLPLLIGAAFVALRAGVAVTVVLVVAMLAAAQAWVPGAHDPVPSRIALAPSLPYFVAGFAAAVVHRMWRPSTATARVLLDTAGWLALAWWCFANVFGPPPPSIAWLQAPLWRGLVWALVVLAAVDAGRGISAVFSALPLRVVGVVSFSVYLLHMPIVEALRNAGGWSEGARSLAILAAVLAVSMLSYMVIEYPFIEFGRRLSRRTTAGADT